MKRHIGPLLKLILLLAFLSRLEFVFGQAPYKGATKGAVAHTAEPLAPKAQSSFAVAGSTGVGHADNTLVLLQHPGSAELQTWHTQQPVAYPAYQPQNALGNQASSLGNAVNLERLQLKASPKAFSSKTDLIFTLKQDGNYKLEVLNMQGMVVAVLAENNGQAGETRIYQFKKDRFPAGGYIARLITENEVTSTRFMLE